MLAVFALMLFTTSWGVARRVAESKATALRVPIDERNRTEESHFTNASQEKRGLLLRIGRGGFEPGEITVRPGEYFVVILNGSHLRSMSIAFQREGGELVGQNRLSRESTRWTFRTQLSPGTYIVTSSARPDWMCRITVTSN